MQSDIRRPNPLQWLRYSYLGAVPAKNAAWVLHDATCRTWILRHILRYLMLVAPAVVAVIVFLPTSMAIRVEGCVAAAGSVLIGYLCFTTESIEQRVEKAGFEYGVAGRIREQRGIDAQRAVAARARARRAAR